MPRRVRRRPPPQGLFEATIDDLAHDGRGIAHRGGKAIFIHGGLPGEQVQFRYTAAHSQFDEGRVEAILHASADRVEPRCAHFGVCGGCSLQHLAAVRQIEYKQAWLLDNLHRIGKVQPAELLPPLIGPHWAYRYKARLGVRYVAKKGRVLVGFRERDSRFLADLRRCEILHPQLGSLLEQLGDLISELSIYQRLPQIEVAAGDNTLALSFRVLDPPTEADKAQLREFAERHSIQVYLQPKGPATTELLWPQNAELNYCLPEFELDLAFLPYHFTQVNPVLNRQMVGRALALLDVQGTDKVLDLFCGLGNFTLPLARRAASVVGVEGEASLVEWAGRNATRNEVNNIRFYSADLAIEDDNMPVWAQDYDKALLDPPRSGALAVLPQLARCGPRRIVYVSCHPATLARDAGELVHQHGYRLLQAGVMDMFPHTAHVESIAVFEKLFQKQLRHRCKDAPNGKQNR